MNYLEIINKCLLELNYKQVSSFSELVKNDHKKLMTILNIVNQEICDCDNWNFLLRKTTIPIPQNQTEVTNTVNGRIKYIFIDGERYKYIEDIEPFMSGKANGKVYSLCSDKLLFPEFDSDKTADIIYYTKNCVSDENGNEKEELTSATDVSLIPMPFALQLLTYGACLRMKANPSYIRFSYWMSMYKEALANMRSKISIDSEYSPVVRLFRQ